MADRVRAAVVAMALVLVATAARADEKLVLLEDAPRDVSRLKVAADGRRVFLAAGGQYFVVDADGVPVDRIRTPEGSNAKDLIPLPNGWFVACDSHGGGHLALCRPDGTEVKVLVGKGADAKLLRADTTAWTSPGGAAVDAGRRRIFALDTTMAPRGEPDPDWSRIASFDLDGKYLGDINRYDAKDPGRDDARRTWYDDIAVDPRRQRIYVTARRTEELLAFTYDGRPAGRVKAPGRGGIAVFPDGRVGVGSGHTIRLFGPDLRPIRDLDVSAQAPGGITDLEADAAGRLYATTADPGVWFLRWSVDLEGPRSFGPRYRRVRVEFPHTPVPAGVILAMPARAEGRPAPTDPGAWRAMVRPADGSDLRWQPLPAEYREGYLRVQTPADLRGPHELAVRFGAGPIDLANRGEDPSLQRTVAFVPAGAVRSVSALTATGRRAFHQGEPVPLHVIRRGAGPASALVRLDLLGPGGAGLATARVAVRRNLAVELSAALTRRLPPGRYALRPSATGHEGYALALDIAPADADSPMQRILYQEFTQGATAPRAELADAGERLAYIRDYARAAAELGFTRETDRLAGKLGKDGPVAWRRDRGPADVAAAGGLAPADYFAIPAPDPGSQWEAEFYLDQAVRHGLSYDSQLLQHCAGARFREPWFRELVPTLQRGAQWFGRYPSFYGFNYNDEMFFGGPAAADWSADDDAWLERVGREKFRGKPRADVLMYALRTMYDRFDAAVRQVEPRARITTTPMWQFPAAEGSYAPAVYRGMDETYSHYLSEGFALPWYPAHSAEFLRRPGLPLMGVFDNGQKGEGGEVYLKNVMQVAARGAQGVGVEHTRPFEDPHGADAYRTANRLARMYGAVFAEAPPANEAAVLYSYAQDVTESRSTMGTPHWERVFALVGAGLMAGVPMGVAYEEDVASGWLLEGGRPRVPMLFLVGQARPLPPKVRAGIAAFVAAGGKVFADADSAPIPSAARLPFGTYVLKEALAEGYAADSAFPLAQPPLRKLAADLAAAVGASRRFPIDTDDPWVSKNGFDGGAIRYVMVASETSPYPWDAGTVWSLGTFYNKTYLPKVVALSFPSRPGVVYDVFDRERVEPTVAGGTARLSADLTTFPGRLYALAPAPLGPPRITAGVRGDGLDFRVEAVDEDGRALAARVPVRIRLHAGGVAAQEIYRGTGPDGTLAASLPLPATAESWTLEVTELLGGRGSEAVVPGSALPRDAIARRPDVEPRREDRVRALLKEASGVLTLVAPKGGALGPQRRRELAAALKGRGLGLRDGTPPREPAPGVYLVAGHLADEASQGELLAACRRRGLLEFATSAEVPGPGRGFFTAAFAPRGDREHCIALIGGDADGLGKTIDAFINWLGTPGPAPAAESSAATVTTPALDIRGRPAQVAAAPRLRDMVGARLAGVAVAGDGEHLVVAADGYLRNLALIKDDGHAARVIRATRVGQAPTVEGAFVADDGARFGASAREAARFGEGLHLVDPGTGAHEVFAAFGNVGWQHHRFAVSARGDVVVAPGAYGVACWRRQGGTWTEAWAIDYWKEFQDLDWPVADLAERIPQFHAAIPRGADYALVLHGELSPNGWVTPENHGRAWLAAVALADGKERWRFDVPVSKTLLFPTLHTSPDGSRALVQVQMGAWGKETFRFFDVAGGEARGSWDARTTPLATAVADGTGRIASAYQGRLLEVREPGGSLAHSLSWRDQPVSLAFAADGLGLYVADDAGRLTCLDANGRERWHLELRVVAALAARGRRLYAAGWDGRLRSFADDGRFRWELDCTPALADPRPLAMVAESAKVADGALHRARRAPTTSDRVPPGANLLRGGKATLTVGGTKGWMSDGKVQVQAAALVNGRADDMETPWLSTDELFWDATAGRQVWAEIAFKEPTDVRALTVREDPRFPDSWPTEGLVQTWDEGRQAWRTAARGVFLAGPVNTYALGLKKVTRLRYVPWADYYRNFHTSEIEVR